ncbi:muscarinic acetylcholine receptor M2-like [Paramacrobiotus metropolitanus]|uniref:muscarinic acetylcholine receptor M2-like n=1 Tax=Paramacrobiotus metropolitanus TaxID=2943436 RepID=UPI002445645F|nr:muscarinic acetylcholine receptor M2-like [Paramacrobiotus metropolitanus]
MQMHNINNSTNTPLPTNISTPYYVSAWVLLPLVSLIISTVITNLTIIATFLIIPSVRTVFNYYLFNLAISDCLTGSVSMTHFALLTVLRHWPLSRWQCTIWVYFDFLGTSQTLLTITIIALDRLWAISWPVSYRQRHTEKKCIILICFSWIWSNLVIVPSLVYNRIHRTSTDEKECYWSIDEPYASSLYVAIFTQWLPSAVTVCCYVKTSWKLWSKHRAALRIRTAETAPDIRDVVRKKKQRQAFGWLSALLAALVLQWSPWFIYRILDLSSNYESNEFYEASYWLQYSLSAVNPFLFILGSLEMHNGIKLLFHKICKLK